MRYIYFLILFVFSLSSVAVHAQERIGYRVEVIVFRLVQAELPPESALLPRDYSCALDLARLQKEREEWIAAWELITPQDALAVDLDPPLTAEASQFTIADGLSYIPELGEQMSGVWRNLRLSAEYRPEARLSWEQRAQGDFPPLRLHNEEIILIEDDHADQRVPSAVPEEDAPAPVRKIFHYDLASGILELSPVPDPRLHFSVDGEVRLRRSRFLHIDLDLEYRIPAPATLAGTSGPPLMLKHQGYEVYSLKQSRQIRTGRMEYFDSPVLGALVWVSAIEKQDDETDQ